jgi:hypothetical protein
LGEEVGFDEVRPDFGGTEIEVIGNLSFKFDHVDHYSSSHMKGTTLMYISYLKSLKLERSSVVVQDTESFKIPGDLSSLAKERGMYSIKEYSCFRSEHFVTDTHTYNNYYRRQIS